ncbi:hypothetical protein HJFPF1_07122 [Paramyrothecium foliicola]|nr:hypothetical protein HJFPF1_07122 [Paramyrothecium foliicola]
MFARFPIARGVSRLATQGLRVTAPRRVEFRRFSTKNASDQIQVDPQIQAMMEKAVQHPGALAAMQNIGQLFQDKGFGPEKMPSKMDLFKLMMDKDFREAAQKLTEELQNAGVDMDPGTLMKMMEQSKN